MGKFKPNYKLNHVMTPENTNQEVIEQMQNHVDSYISLSRHNHNCLELCRRLEAAEATIKLKQDALDAVRKFECELEDERVDKPPMSQVYISTVLVELRLALAKAEQG